MQRTDCVQAGGRLDSCGPEVATLIRALDPRAWRTASADTQLLEDVAQIRGILLRSASGHDPVTSADLQTLQAMARRREPLEQPASRAVANAARLAAALVPRPSAQRLGGAPRWFALAAMNAG